MDRNGTTQDTCTILHHSLIFEGTSNCVFLLHALLYMLRLVLCEPVAAVAGHPFAAHHQPIHKPNTADDPSSRKAPPEVSNVISCKLAILRDP